MSIKKTVHNIKSKIISFFGKSKNIAPKKGDNIARDKKTYNINNVGTADFGNNNIKNGKNLVGQGIEAGGNVRIGDTTTTIIYGNGQKIPKYLGSTPTFPSLFIGRENEPETIHQSLVDHDNHQNTLLLVNGRGGIGKTTLAARYYYQYQDYYEHLVWVFSGTGIIAALLSLKTALKVEFTPKMTEADQLEALIKVMKQLNKPCLLVIDNANELDDLQKHHNTLLKCTNFHILLTTRVNTEIHNTKIYEVKSLSDEAALLLFTKHYPAHQTKDNDLFLKIFKAVNRNTLVVELLAKNLTNFNSKLEKRYHLTDLLQDISDNLLNLSKTKKVNTFYQAQSGKIREEKPEKIIAAMYDLSKLDAIEKRLLSILAVLPAENMPYSRLKELILQNELDQHLLRLSKKGWLDYDDTENNFRISPVVQEVIRLKREDFLYKDCEVMIYELIEKLKYQGIDGHLENVTYEEAAILVRYGDSIIKNIKALEYNIGILCERIGRFYRTTGNLKLALEFFEKDIELTKELNDSYPSNVSYKNGLAISYEKLGETHSSLGNLKLALEFFEKNLELRKELNDSYPSNVSYKNGLAISYEKLGSTHSSLGNLKLALEFFEKDIELTKELNESYPSNVSYKNGLAISYSKLGETHSSLGNLKLALEFFEKYNKLRKELNESYPSNVSYKNGLAISYSKLGSTHSSLGNLKLALEFFEKYNKLFEELNDSYPSNVSYKNGLAISYAKLGQYYQAEKNNKKAFTYFKNAEQLWEELVIQSPQYVEFQENLEEVQNILKELK